jgi:hypothetical protein
MTRFEDIVKKELNISQFNGKPVIIQGWHVQEVPGTHILTPNPCIPSSTGIIWQDGLQLSYKRTEKNRSRLYDSYARICAEVLARPENFNEDFLRRYLSPSFEVPEPHYTRIARKPCQESLRLCMV